MMEIRARDLKAIELADKDKVIVALWDAIWNKDRCIEAFEAQNKGFRDEIDCLGKRLEAASKDN